LYFQPFLDAKEVADRIVEVVMNYDKVRKSSCTYITPFSVWTDSCERIPQCDLLHVDDVKFNILINSILLLSGQIKKENVTAVARFKEDLDLDSLDAVEIVMLIEEEFSIEIPDAEADKIASVADAVAYVSSHPMAK
jgi:acyl carrier protein